MKHRWAVSILFLVASATSGFAGQGLILTPGTRYSGVNDPLLSETQDWVVEFQFHEPAGGWTTGSGGSYIFDYNGVGVRAWIDGNGRLAIDDKRDTLAGGSPCLFQLTGTSYTNILARIHRDRSNPSAQALICEIWEYDGSKYALQVRSITAINSWTFNGGALGSTEETNVVLDWLRIIQGTKPIAIAPPTTFTEEDSWTWIKFDGNGSDASGNGHSVSLSGASYENTPNQQAIANFRTMDAPNWSNWAALDAGDPNQLDATVSYSLSDTVNTVTYLWQQLDGPSQVRWSSHTTAQPIIEGLVFGQYTFQLTVTDGSSTSSTELEIGAVAQDENHVVIPADPNVETLFGPMIAWGHNPWGYTDERAMAALDVRQAQYNLQEKYNSYSLNPPSWDVEQAGTVSYTWNGTGQAFGANCTTLTAQLDDTGTTIDVADASCLELASFPTYVNITATGSGLVTEEIKICSATATSGAATLTICYDGRGKDDASGLSAVVGPTTWASGSRVGQQLVLGTGTNFLADPDGVCPGGAEGPAGPVTYSTGTVSLTAGSSTLTGEGTLWSGANDVNVGDAVRIEATHDTGTPFIFVAYIASIDSPTQITLNRIFPADADTDTGLNYGIIRALSMRNIVTHFDRVSDGSDALVNWRATSCASTTQAFFNIGIVTHDVSGYNGGLSFSGQGWSILDVGGHPTGVYIANSATGGINFYGEGLAWEALYWRSGLTKARTASRAINDHWIRYPVMAGGVGGPVYFTLTVGGGVISSFAAKVLDPDSGLEWTDLRPWEALGNTSSVGCNANDTRDSSYRAAWATLGALFDPDSAAQAAAKGIVAAIYTNRDSAGGLNCKRDDNSFSNAQNHGEAIINVGLTNGSTAVTGTGLTPGLCDGIGSGTATVTNGSYAITSSAAFPSGMTSILLHGTKDSNPYNAFYVFTRTDASNGTIPVRWQGDSGPVTFLARNFNVSAPATYMSLGSNRDDTSNLLSNYACTFNSPTSLTLDRNWPGSTGTYKLRVSNVGGHIQQPFMQGINATRLRWASNLDDELGTDNESIWKAVSSWVHDVGYSQDTRGLHYATVTEFCSKDRVDPTSYPQIPGCDSASAGGARALNAESMSALRGYYASEAESLAARDWGDELYGAVYGFCSWAAEDVPCGSYETFLLANEQVDNGKWAGFFFGMGMAHQWPAIRVGGLAPAAEQQAQILFVMGGADHADIRMTAPNGVESTYTCTSSPCAVDVDLRQGSYLYTIQFMSATNQPLAPESIPEILLLP